MASLEAFELALKELAALVQKVDRHDEDLKAFGEAVVNLSHAVEDITRELVELRMRLP